VVLGGVIEIGAVREEPAHGGGLAIARGDHQAGLSVLVERVDVRAGGQ
jgi:hypothetical protein